MPDEQVLARPIGWWLKEADARLNAAFAGALENSGVDRRGWQVLSSLARQPTSREDLVVSLAAFDSPPVVEGVVDDLEARGRVEDAGGLLRLTVQGAREQAALAPLIDDVRRRISVALPQDEYVTLIRLLARLTEAL